LSSEEERRREEERPSEETVGEPPAEEPPREESLEDPEAVPIASEAGEPPVVAEDAVAPEVSPEALEELEVEPEEEVEMAREEVGVLLEEVETARRERDEYLDGMMRMKAELENARKRQERDRVRLREMASEKLVRELLPVVDNLERALEVEGDIHEGVRATRDQFLGVLAREGVEPVASDGEPLDPAVHEAVMMEPSEEREEGTVLRTFERGYVMNGKTIRPAKVVVAS
jgi:molecular chaperone GrpE